jgi:hypothetical protein
MYSEGLHTLQIFGEAGKASVYNLWAAAHAEPDLEVGSNDTRIRMLRAFEHSLESGYWDLQYFKSHSQVFVNFVSPGNEVGSQKSAQELCSKNHTPSRCW